MQTIILAESQRSRKGTYGDRPARESAWRGYSSGLNSPIERVRITGELNRYRATIASLTRNEDPMTLPIKSISLEGMSIAERILLVEQIWDGIAAEPEAIEVTQAQRDELDRRLAAFDADPAAGSSWQDVKQRIQRKS